MDWRNNAWVGIGAAGLLVVFIIVVVWYAGSSGKSAVEGSPTGLQFECDSCGGHFRIEMAALEDFTIYSKYMREYGTPGECERCGGMEAYAAYFCPAPACNKWYRYTRAQGSAQDTYCPEGHKIPEEHQ
jgi:hypothetical protein